MKGLVQLVRDEVWTLEDASKVYRVLMDKITYLNNVQRMEEDKKERGVTARLEEEWFERAREAHKNSTDDLELIEDILERTYECEQEWIPVEREYLQTFASPYDIPCDNKDDCWYIDNKDRLVEYDRSYKSRFGNCTYCDVCIDNKDYGVSDFADKYTELFCHWLKTQPNKRIKVDK